MTIRLFLMFIIRSIITAACWTTLAIVFDKWWLLLFVLPFMATDMYAQSWHRVCDGCGKHSPYAFSYNDAIDTAKKNGWLHVGTNRDYCPECKNKEHKEE